MVSSEFCERAPARGRSMSDTPQPPPRRLHFHIRKLFGWVILCVLLVCVGVLQIWESNNAKLDVDLHSPQSTLLIMTSASENPSHARDLLSAETAHKCPRTPAFTAWHKTGTVLARDLAGIVTNPYAKSRAVSMQPWNSMHLWKTGWDSVSPVYMRHMAHYIRTKPQVLLLDGSVIMNEDFSQFHLHDNFTVVEFLRDPVNALISAMKYHKSPFGEKLALTPFSVPEYCNKFGEPGILETWEREAEEWWLRKNPKAKRQKATDWAEFCRAHVTSRFRTANASLQQIFTALPPKDALLVTFLQFSLQHWSSAQYYEQIRQHKCVLVFFLDDYMRSYDNSSKCLMDFMNDAGLLQKPVDTAVKEAKMLDTSVHPSNHATNSLKLTDHEKLEKLLVEDQIVGPMLKYLRYILDKPRLNVCK